MDSTTALISFAMVMWLAQILLGWRQIKAFNRVFMEISRKGKITVGRNSGRFNPKAVVVLAFDEQKKVVDSLCMKGFSVFAKPQKLTEVIGLHLDEIVPEKLFPQSKKLQFALKIALATTHNEK